MLPADCDRNRDKTLGARSHSAIVRAVCEVALATCEMNEFTQQTMGGGQVRGSDHWTQHGPHQCDTVTPLRWIRSYRIEKTRSS